MLGHAIAQMMLADRGHWSAGALMALFSLLVFCGLLRPPRRRTRVTPQPAPRPEQVVSSTTRLNAIELALIAELNLERARAHDEVANDHTQRPATRRSASVEAAAWRERARLFQLQARRESARPVVPDSTGPPATPYIGPERRRQARRTVTRRAAPAEPGQRDRRISTDRRAGADRRQGDRRRPGVPPTALQGVART